MADYRLIGFFDDTGIVYDCVWPGADECLAVNACRLSLTERDAEELCLAAILDENGTNIYEGDTVSFIRDWPRQQETGGE